MLVSFLNSFSLSLLNVIGLFYNGSNLNYLNKVAYLRIFLFFNMVSRDLWILSCIFTCYHHHGWAHCRKCKLFLHLQVWLSWTCSCARPFVGENYGFVDRTILQLAEDHPSLHWPKCIWTNNVKELELLILCRNKEYNTNSLVHRPQ